MSETNQNGWIVRDNTGIAVYGVVNGDLRIRHETYNGDIADDITSWLAACSVDLFPSRHIPREFEPRLAETTWNDLVSERVFDKQKKALSLFGNPGIGKTTTMQYLVRKAEEKQESGAFLAGSMFFLTERTSSVSVEAALMHLMRTFYVQMSQVPQSLKDLYRRCSKAGRSGPPDVLAIMSVLTDILTSAPQTCVFIDAIDECKDIRALTNILDAVQQLQNETGVGIVFTDREPSTLPRTGFLQLTRKRLGADDLDMRAYIRNDINHNSWSTNLDPTLVDRAVDTICQASTGNFLLIRLHVMSLNLRHVNDETLVNALDTIRATTIISEFRGAGYLGSNSTPSQEWQTYETQVLDKAYRNNIERIMDETIEPSMPGLAKKIFGVLLTSVRRLTVEELQHAICAIRQSDVPPDFTTTRLYSWEDLQKVCRGMIQADQAGFVVFMHSSLGTYLERSRVFFQDRQSVMAAACLRYLAMDTFSQGICTTVESLEERMNKWPFFPYAARYWGRHINHRIDSSLSGNDFAAQTIKPQKACACDNRCALATEFLGLDRNVESAFQIECLPDRLENQLFRKLCSGHSMDDFLQCLKVVLVITEGSKPEETRSILKRNHKCGLHWACELSCPTMFNELKICKESALDRQDWNGRSPLILAARSGNSAFTSTLLDLGVKPDVADSGGMTALAWASRQGHQLIVDTLLGHRDRVDPNSVDELVRSNWVDSIIPVGKKQLDLDGIVSIASIGGRTPLHHAARNNHIGIVQSLLKDSRTNVNHFDGDGLNVLHRAAKKGHVELVRLFIEHPDIDPARRVCEKTRGVYDKRWNTRHPGKTFLHLASRHQYCQAVVKYAVECHTDLLYTRDDAGQTPLHCAVECGAVVNVKILLEEPSIDPNIQDSSKRTPLHLSVVNARPDVLLELLGHPKTNPDLQDNDGLTPLGVSIRYGNEEAYQSILQYWGHAHWALATTPQIRLTRNFVSKSANLAFVIQPWSKHSPHFVEPSPIYGVAIIGPRA